MERMCLSAKTFVGSVGMWISPTDVASGLRLTPPRPEKDGSGAKGRKFFKFPELDSGEGAAGSSDGLPVMLVTSNSLFVACSLSLSLFDFGVAGGDISEANIPATIVLSWDMEARWEGRQQMERLDKKIEHRIWTTSIMHELNTSPARYTLSKSEIATRSVRRL